MASSKLNLDGGDFLGIYGHLGLLEAYTCVSFVGYQILLRSLVSGLNAWTIYMFVLREEYLVNLSLNT